MGYKNYSIDMEQIVQLSNLDEFVQFWKYTSYGDLSTIFNPKNPCYFKSTAIRDKPKQVDALFIFKHGIAPAWEDPKHVKGGYFQSDFSFTEQELDDFWESLIIWLMCGDYEFYDVITGFRIIDNLKQHNSIRFEVWFTCGYEYYRKNGTEEQFKKNQEMVDNLRDVMSGVFPEKFNISKNDFAYKDIWLASSK